MNDNPYAAPQTESKYPSGEKPKSGLAVASQSRRLINHLADRVIIVGFHYWMAQQVAVLLLKEREVTEYDLFTFRVVSFGLSTLFIFTYFVYCESTFGKTFGKVLTGTRVVDENGSSATTGKIIGRTLCRFIPFEAFSFMFTRNSKFPVGWHDSISKTRVVRD